MALPQESIGCVCHIPQSIAWLVCQVRGRYGHSRIEAAFLGGIAARSASRSKKLGPRNRLRVAVGCNTCRQCLRQIAGRMNGNVRNFFQHVGYLM